MKDIRRILSFCVILTLLFSLIANTEVVKDFLGDRGGAAKMLFALTVVYFNGYLAACYFGDDWRKK